MKFIHIISILIISYFLNYNSTATENKILLKVDKKIITSYDILVEINYLNTINKNFKEVDYKSSIEIAKTSLIREKVKEIELEKFIDDLIIDDEQLNNILINYFKKFGIKTIDDFNQYFLSQKINPDIVKKKISIELLWNQFIFNKYKNKITIDKDSIKKEIENNNKQKEFLLSEILFDLKLDENLKTKSDKIKTEINDSSFSKAALKFSMSDTAKNGGKLGWLKSSVLSSEIISNLEKIDIGEYTSPITIPGGFLILMIEDIKISKVEVNLEKEMKYIVQQKTDQQLNQLSNIYLRKIKKNIKINEL